LLFCIIILIISLNIWLVLWVTLHINRGNVNIGGLVVIGCEHLWFFLGAGRDFFLFTTFIVSHFFLFLLILVGLFHHFTGHFFAVGVALLISWRFFIILCLIFVVRFLLLLLTHI
jgi:hypothetical protein